MTQVPTRLFYGLKLLWLSSPTTLYNRNKRRGQRAKEGHALIVAWGDFMPGVEGIHITAGEAGKCSPDVQSRESDHQALRITQPSQQSANSRAILCLT